MNFLKNIFFNRTHYSSYRTHPRCQYPLKIIIPRKHNTPFFIIKFVTTLSLTHSPKGPRLLHDIRANRSTDRVNARNGGLCITSGGRNSRGVNTVMTNDVVGIKRARLLSMVNPTWPLSAEIYYIIYIWVILFFMYVC